MNADLGGVTSPYRESEGMRQAVRAHERQLADHALREATRACIVVVTLGACFALLAWVAVASGAG
jgi:hypothetical protein